MPDWRTAESGPERSTGYSVGLTIVGQANGTAKMARILCIDDEPAALKLKCSILEGAGHEIVSATSLQEALDHLEKIDFDAVVTDWQLGDQNAREIVQVAKSYPPMPVVVVSGYMLQAFHAAEPTADLYLEKPVKPDELIMIIKTLLRTM